MLLSGLGRVLGRPSNYRHGLGRPYRTVQLLYFELLGLIWHFLGHLLFCKIVYVEQIHFVQWLLCVCVGGEGWGADKSAPAANVTCQLICLC